MHDEIIRYSMEGTVRDGNIVSQKEQFVRFVETQMRDDGVAPVLDLAPQFTLDYDPESETFAFSLSVYGSYVGGSEAWALEGVMAGTTITKYTPPTKLKESSDTQK